MKCLGGGLKVKEHPHTMCQSPGCPRRTLYCRKTINVIHFICEFDFVAEQCILMHIRINLLLKGTQWTLNTTYQVPDIAWLKMGGRGGRKKQRDERDAQEKRKIGQKKKQAQSMSKEERSKTTK